MDDARDFFSDVGRSFTGPTVGEACGEADDREDELMSSSFRFEGDGLAFAGSVVSRSTLTAAGLGGDCGFASAMAFFFSIDFFLFGSPIFWKNCSSVWSESLDALKSLRGGAIVQQGLDNRFLRIIGID